LLAEAIIGRLKKTLKQVNNVHTLCQQDKDKLHAMADPYIKKITNALAKPRAALTGENT
jgi:hypothetical protein